MPGFIVPKEEIKKAPLLEIIVKFEKNHNSQVVEGLAVDRNTKLRINACSLIGSKRNKGDGCTIIGSQEMNAGGEVQNDFVIP